MAFNKTKIVETAQKYLNQGKIPQAIEQYQQLLHREPEDQVTLMTIGDLYVRAHDIRQALDYFERLAQLFANDGFTSKSIAIYKKIAKLAPDEIGPLERLAELYVQQGVMSEARPIYLQLAEAHLKANRASQAVEVLKKLLELSPDNLRVQVRLAELYEGIGQPRAAAEAFTGAAQRMLEKGEVKEAQRLADRAAKADPNNPGGLALKASILAESGHGSEALALLEKATPTDEIGTLLTEMYLQSGDAEKAVAMGRKAIGRGTPHLGVAYNVALALIGAGDADRGVQLLGETVKPAIDAGDTERLAQMLGTASAQLPGRLEPLEWRAQVYRRTGDTYHLPEALAAIAAVATDARDLPRAKAAYEELLRNDPENENYRQSLARVCALMGLEAPVHVEAGAPPQVDITPVEAAPVALEPQLDEETERFVQQALTDVDLFSSYGLTQKGIDLLESVLQRVPNHAPTLEKLLDLCLGAGNDRRTADLAAHLQQIYTDRGDSGNAERFAELRRRFERAAGRTETAAAEPPPVEFAVPAAPPAPQPEQVEEVEAEPVEAEVHEVDLSEEWATVAETAPPDAAPPPPEVPVEAAESESEFRMEIDVEEGTPAVPAEPAPAEVAASSSTEPEPQPVGAQSASGNGRATAEVLDELSAEAAEGVEASAAAEEAAYEIESARRPAEPAAMTSDQFLSELGAELEDFEISAPPPAGKTSGKQAAASAALPRGRKQMDQLREVFDEFKAEMGEVGDAEAEAEDLETHYNLGIAYREMGLLEEAIGEFQKVAKSIKGGRPFRYSMQCYTLLGLSFMDKNQPKIAAIWYEQALRTPELDQESILAVRYDLGVAHELAGDSQAALDSFSQVYAMNIDYRDVAERITALSKQS